MGAGIKFGVIQCCIRVWVSGSHRLNCLDMNDVNQIADRTRRMVMTGAAD